MPAKSDGQDRAAGVALWKEAAFLLGIIGREAGIVAQNGGSN